MVDEQSELNRSAGDRAKKNRYRRQKRGQDIGQQIIISQEREDHLGGEGPDPSNITSSPFDGIPSHIIPSIISLLPIHEAARTSTLSHTWSDLWTWVTQLDLSRRNQAARGETTEKCCALKTDEVDHILSSLRADIITNFRIPLCVQRHSPSDVRRWVEFSERKGVQSLALLKCHSHRDFYEKVLSEFHIRCETLKELELSRCQLSNAACFEESKNLTTLKLFNVELKLQTLECILSNCSSLERLLLRECSGHLKRIKICYPPNLKLLELTKFISPYVAPLEIRATNLQVLVTDMVERIEKIDAPDLNILSSGQVFFENTPLQRYEAPGYNDEGNPNLLRALLSICDAEFLGHYFSLYGVSPVESPMQYQFDKLQGLFIKLDLHDIMQNILLAFILRRCTHLRELDIKLVREPSTYQSDEREDWVNYWEKRVSADCVVLRLKKTWLTGFTAHDLQLGFVKFLINKSPALRELQIRFHKNFPKKLVKATSAQLHSVPRASFDLRVNILMTSSE